MVLENKHDVLFLFIIGVKSLGITFMCRINFLGLWDLTKYIYLLKLKLINGNPGATMKDINTAIVTRLHSVNNSRSPCEVHGLKISRKSCRFHERLSKFPGNTITR